jgi:menaquinone-specific isochorismate synthase
MTMSTAHSVSPETAKAHLGALIEESLAREAAPDTAVRLEVPVAPVNAVAWMQAQGPQSRGYWRNRNGSFELAGIGRADMITAEADADYDAIFDHLQRHIARVHPDLRYLGGMRFSTRRSMDDKWTPFGAYRFILPRFEILNRGKQSYLACNLVFHPDSDAPSLNAELQTELAEMTFPEAPATTALPRCLSRKDAPNHDDWVALVAKTLGEVRAGRFDKAVLARETNLAFDAPLDPAPMLARLIQATHDCYLFCFQPKAGAAFFGASPERLFKRRGRHLETEALAGTRARGETPEKDAALSDTLLSSKKDRHEHRIVLDTVRALLEERCHAVHVDKDTSLKKLARSQHLFARLEGLLAEDETNATLLRDLHPTPAVGGLPREAAVDFLDAHEPFDRGWYGGPVGWVSADAAEFAVGIRSGVIADNALSLYSGAGIVEGSVPEDEWSEIENKLSNLLHPLQAGL